MRTLVLALFVGTAACGAAPSPGTSSPSSPLTTPAAPRADDAVFTVDGPVREEQLPLLRGPVVDVANARFPAPPAGLAAEPPACAAFASRKGSGAACGADAIASLDTAIAEASPDKRDAMLADLEACPGIAPGIVRALRADLAPMECAESIATPFLQSPPKAVDGWAYSALEGLAIAGRLARLGTHAPSINQPYDKKKLQEFIKGPMLGWFQEQATAIQATEQLAAGLTGYAKGVSAIEAALADFRIVEALRGIPLPKEWGPEEKSAYYGSLDQSLDPRKDRGRDAALVGLREMATTGVIRDARVTKARTLLSQLYGGRRIDALDGLVVPPLPAASPSSAEERLAAKLPAFYSGLLLDPSAATRPGTMRMFLESGVPLAQRTALRGATLSPDVRVLVARARLELGRTYWRAVDFDQAAALESGAPARTDDATLVLAVALALRHGPEDAAAMMRRAPLADGGMGKVDALDAIAAKNGALAGQAAYDAAYVKQIAAPDGADAKYWKDVAQRYRSAASLVADASLKQRANDRAVAADAVAAEIQSK